MTDQTLYEIADSFGSLMDLLDELTSPDPNCRMCNPDNEDEVHRNLRKTAAGDDWGPCPACDDTGRVQPLDDQGMFEALQEAMDDIELSLRDKTENIMRLIQSWEVMEGMIKAEEERLREKRKVYERKRGRLKKYLAKHMSRTGLKKIETSIKNAHLYKGRASVIIDDEFALPQGTFDTELLIKPDKKLIGERLKNDIDTPGAHTETGDPYVMFR